MNLQECYELMGGDYAQLQSRIPKVDRVGRFLAMFSEDTSYAELKDALEKGDRESAFRAAHTLKGICGNLSMTRLFSFVSELTELLRQPADAVPSGAGDIFENVKREYESTVEVIRRYLESAN